MSNHFPRQYCRYCGKDNIEFKGFDDGVGIYHCYNCDMDIESQSVFEDDSEDEQELW